VGNDDEALTDELRALAGAHGVTVTYLDHGGIQRTAKRAAVLAVLEAVGVAGASENPGAALAEHHATTPVLDAVLVVDAGGPPSVTAVVPSRTGAIECELVTEDGASTSWRAPVEGAALHGAANGVVVALTLPHGLEAGYHALTARAGKLESTAHLLARPEGGARGRFDASWRAVGVAAPLFTLHSSRSWGCGDLADLDAFAALSGTHGATVVTTLPLLAGFGPTPFEPSPYIPASRLFWHERWLDMDTVVAHAGAPGLSSLASEARRRVREAAERAHPYVDGEGSMRAKRDVLEALLGALSRDDVAELAAFLEADPSVTDFARFRAAGERHGLDWAAWPQALRDGAIGAADVEDAAVRYHELAQWLCDVQLRGLAERFESRGQVLSLDLPLGVHRHGYDVWRYRDQYLEGTSVGAPPDRFFPRGQVWGFPPPRITAARAEGHGLFRAALRHHLGVAGMLRIDHILGTQRLFCVPDGMPASDGVYLRMPLEELLAVIAIEAQRCGSAIVGEDLGTVEAPVRRAMQRDGVRRTSVVQLSIKSAGVAPYVDPPAGAVSSFSTHDLATFEGWWRASDIDERVSLAQIDAAMGDVMRAQRRVERARLSTLLDPPDPPSRDAPLDGPPPEGLLAAVHDSLADSDAGLVLVQLDDVLGEREAVNLPGTSTERRNWQRRTELPLEAIAVDPRLTDALDEVHARRTDATHAGDGRGRSAVATVHGVTRFGPDDESRFAAGRHARIFEHLGAHPMEVGGMAGTYFATWAPNAADVEVVGDFNGWDGHRHPLARREGSGIWEGLVPDLGDGERYKFRITTAGGDVLDKADPYARRSELAPRTASIIHTPRHVWEDGDWMASRAARHSPSAPIAVYEVHLGSWRRDPEDPSRLLTYRELAPMLVEYVGALGFTHVELMPVMEHPYYESWGYQLSGYLAPTARYGSPDDLAALIDELHRAGIGVLLDWVPAHFPDDEFALGCFDGSHLYEHPDPRMRVHPDWHSLIFNYARGEVRSFLISAACSWLEDYHADGLRFDAVASMLYLDYSRGDGEWVPNVEGGNENLEAVSLLQDCNDEIHRSYPGAISVAEESTAWPGVTAPVEGGGLGFDYKWDLGWMHDTLDYLHKDPVHRSWHHDQLTFRAVYSRSEQFLLPLSHDEVVHGKGSLYDQMGGDVAQRLANLRLLYGFQLLQPGKKLLFMGDEFGQVREWSVGRPLDWELLDEPAHAGIATLVAELNALYRSEPSLHRDDLEDRGFRWVDSADRLQSVICVERHVDESDDGRLVIVCNATPEARSAYVVGLPGRGIWTLRCTSDDVRFGGSGHRARAAVTAVEERWHGRRWRAELDLPPLGFVIYGQGAAKVPEAVARVH